MADIVQVQWDDAEIIRALQNLQNLQNSVGNISTPLKEIGEDLVKSTKKRFETSTGPDGARWSSNTASTLSHKDGDKPLVGETHRLQREISWDVSGDELSVGSAVEYAAIQQFGGTKTDFPNLWGDIPARPYLGISSQDERTILETIRNYLAHQF